MQSVRVWSYLPYVSKANRKSTDNETVELVYAVKNNRRVNYNGPHGFDALWERASEELTDWVGGATLVPIPPSSAGSAALLSSGPYNLATYLARALGVDLQCAVSRTTTVTKSSGGPNRPTIDVHLKSLQCAAVHGHDIILVDDVVTRGAHMAACAQILQAAGANSVRGLAAAHTLLGDGVRDFGRVTCFSWQPGWGFPRSQIE